jgi:thiamine-phosphate diphosphorylase/hydroxyethylthiazole kinase
MHGSTSQLEKWLDGVAVVSDIVAAPDPMKAAQRLKSIFRASRIAAAKRFSTSRDDILTKALTIMTAVRSLNPLVHQVSVYFLLSLTVRFKLFKMTNVVVANQSANITLALGASPIMATAPEEMSDLSKISHALLVNIGTLVSGSLQGMLKAGHFVNAARNPIILDPVGVGASEFRKNSVNGMQFTHSFIYGPPICFRFRTFEQLASNRHQRECRRTLRLGRFNRSRIKRRRQLG